MNKNLLILGAGMFGSVVKEIAESMKLFDRIDFLDDTYGIDNPECSRLTAPIGRLNDYKQMTGSYDCAIVSIGNPEVRRLWTEKLIEAGYDVPAVVSPNAYVSPAATINPGVVIAPMAVVNPNSSIGTGSFITAGSVIDHNAVVAEYCNIQCGTVITPCANVPMFTKTLPNDVIRNTQQ